VDNIVVTMVEKEIITVTFTGGGGVYAHTHDDRYYTKTQTDAKLVQKVSGYYDSDFRSVINEF